MYDHYHPRDHPTMEADDVPNLQVSTFRCLKVRFENSIDDSIEIRCGIAMGKAALHKFPCLKKLSLM